MLNVAGPEYDFGNVLFAVLQECEHRRRGLPADEPERSEQALRAVAEEKLAEIHRGYRERFGVDTYWRELEREVIETALPQYAPRAVEQTRLECNAYDLWRRGDPFSRAVLGIGGLALGGLIVWLPFIPIFEDAFAFALATGGLFYPEIKRLFFDQRHARFLNRLITQAEKYQQDHRTHGLSNEQLDEVLRPLEIEAAATAASHEPAEEKAGPAQHAGPTAEPTAEAPPPGDTHPDSQPASFEDEARRRKQRERQGRGTPSSHR